MRTLERRVWREQALGRERREARLLWTQPLDATAPAQLLLAYDLEYLPRDAYADRRRRRHRAAFAP